jgi:hypothetical protein
MPLWVLVLLLFVLIKIVIATLMFWLPYRSDTAMSTVGDGHSDTGTDDEGGSKVVPGPPTEPRPPLPLPNRPRRGPHGSPSPSPPPRVRPASRRVVARTSEQR